LTCLFLPYLDSMDSSEEKTNDLINNWRNYFPCSFWKETFVYNNVSNLTNNLKIPKSLNDFLNNFSEEKILKLQDRIDWENVDMKIILNLYKKKQDILKQIDVIWIMENEFVNLFLQI
jgi:hypothetical protein